MRLKKLLGNKSLKIYDDSINTFVKNPVIIVPFFIGYFISLFILPFCINLVGGSKLYSYFYNPNYYIIPDNFILLLVAAVALSMIISSVVISFFDSWGLNSIASIKDKKGVLALKAFILGLKRWPAMIVTSLSTLVIGIALFFPLYLLINSEAGWVIYVIYSSLAAITYGLIVVYPRIAVVKDNVMGFTAVKKGFVFFFRHLGYNIVNMIILGIVFLAFSLTYFANGLFFLAANAFIVTPWTNVFLFKAYKH